MKLLKLIGILLILSRLQGISQNCENIDLLKSRFKEATMLRSEVKTNLALSIIDSLIKVNVKKLQCDSFLAVCYELKGYILQDLTKLQKAKESFDTAAEIMKSRFGGSSKFYAKMLIPISKSLVLLNEIQLARDTIEKAIRILKVSNKDLLIKANATYIQVLQLLGRELEAEQVLVESEGILDSSVSNLSKYILYDNARIFYYQIKLTYKAIYYHEKALEQSILLKNKQFEVYQIGQKADLYINSRDTINANLAFQMALSLINNYYGSNHYLYALKLYNYGVYKFLACNNTNMAETLLDSSIQFLLAMDTSKKNPTVNSQILDIADYLSIFSLVKGNLSKARMYMRISDSINFINQSSLTFDHFNFYYIKALYSFITKDESYNLSMQNMIDNQIREMESALNFMSSQDLEYYISGHGATRTNLVLSLMDPVLINNEFKIRLWELTLLSRKLQLRAKTSFKNFLFQSTDSALMELSLKYKEYTKLEELESDQNQNIYKYKISNIEKKVLSNNDFQKLNVHGKLDFAQYQLDLQKGDLAVEFISYCDPIHSNYDLQYAAVVSNSTSTEPEFIYLFNQSQLRNVLSKNETESNQIIETNFSRSVGLVPREKKNDELYSLVWKPILEKYSEISQIYFAPTGILNQYNLSALKSNDSTFMIDQFQMIQMNSTADIYTLKHSNQIKIESALLMGGMIYNNKSDSAKNYNFLNGSLAEVKDLKELFDHHHINTELWVGEQATELALRTRLENLKSPDLLHLATHGVYQGTMDTSELASNSLKNNYLVLSDAGHVQDISRRSNNNLLDASEISSLNLMNCKLVVLSACESGAGKLKYDSEGIYGFQRGLKIAGADKIIVSLYNIPDHETKELMMLFYNAMFVKNLNIQTAFQFAQLTMKNRYTEKNTWAGFILIN